MSDAQKLKDCIAEYRKENKQLDDKLKEVEANSQQARKAKMEQSNRHT